MICPRCHTENRTSAKFCDECGYELPTVAHVAREMFDDEPETERLGQEPTVDLKGFDLMNDSSYVPGSMGQTVRLGVTNDLGDADESKVTQAFAQPSAMQAQRVYMASGDQKAKSNSPRALAQAYAGAGAKKFSDTPAYPPDAAPSAAKRRATAILIAALCAIVVLAAVAGITYSMQLWGGKVVPDVVGMTSAEAASALEAEGLSADVVQVKSDDVEGIVLSTNPEAGARIDEGSAVTIEVSVPRVIPDVVGLSVDAAETALSKEGFDNVEVAEVKSNEAEGTVVSVSPEPGTRSKADSKITLEASVPYRVPDVKGITAEQAQAALEAEGYVVTTAQVYAEDAAEGTAVGTDPAAGTALDTGSTVVLNLAKHRSGELVKLTEDYLKGITKAKINGLSYEVSNVKSVEYKDGDTCSYVLIARQYETHAWFGSESETRYGNFEEIRGTITWGDNDKVESMSPTIEKI